MRLKDEYNDPNNMVDYYLDTRDGMRTKSSMPAPVAEEIAKRAKTLELCEEEGYELVVNGDTHLPKDIFEVEEGDIEYKAPATKRTTRRKKAAAPKAETE